MKLISFFKLRGIRFQLIKFLVFLFIIPVNYDDYYVVENIWLVIALGIKVLVLSSWIRVAES